MIKGIDVSSYQGNIDWSKVKKAGHSFAFIKASEGVGLTDRHFAANWRESRAVGLVTAAYHFYRPGEDPTVQARHFLAVAPLGTGDLPPICDVEKAGASSPARYGKDLRAWLSVVEAATGLKPILYTSPGVWNGMVSGDFSGWPLWVAHYTAAAAPRLPRGWAQYTFWQYSSSGSVPGINGKVDMDRFSGDQAVLDLLRKQ